MKTTLPLLAICLCLFGLMAPAHAKPKIAVLGLEVIDNGGVDKEATQAAQNLANELRGEAGRNGSKYQLAPNSAKNLLELKLLSNCSDEGRSCMAQIGTDLGADRLLYGKLERRKNGYQISLKLLNTNTRQMEKTTSELVPRADLRNKKISRWARSLYSRLIGVPESGSLSVTANVSKATIYVDGKVATTLRDGAAKVLGLSEGTHKITIEASGYKPYRAEVAITAGGSETLSISLRSEGAEKDENSGNGGWKVAFVSGAVVTAGFLGGTIFNGLKVRGDLDEAKVDAWTTLQAQDVDAYNSITQNTPDGQDVSDSCGKAEGVAGAPSPSLLAFISACRDGEDAATLTNIFLAGTVMAAAATAYFGYQGWFADKSNKERQASRESNRVIVTPQIGPDSIGAGISIEF